MEQWIKAAGSSRLFAVVDILKCGIDPENSRCRLHGGLSLKGEEAPRFKHGRYSKDKPPAE